MKHSPFRDEATLLAEVTRRLEALRSRTRSVIITVDGLAGSGKTTLASRIAQAAGCRCISLDQYLIPHQGTYLPYLRYEDVRRELHAALPDAANVVVVEGLYMQIVLQQLDVKSDISIYIRRISPAGQWLDEYYYSEENNLQEMLDTFARLERLPGKADGDREAVQYQIRERPISSADFLYDRTIILPPSENTAT